jgi:hypothetical protein
VSLVLVWLWLQRMLARMVRVALMVRSVGRRRRRRQRRRRQRMERAAATVTICMFLTQPLAAAADVGQRAICSLG